MSTTATRIILVPLAAILFLAVIYFIAVNSPDQNLDLRFPSSLDDIRSLAQTLATFQERHSLYLLTLFSAAYIFKQTFAVPGSVFLNVLAGALFGATSGFLLCCLLTACGASLCYLLARAVGAELAGKYFPQRISAFQAKLEENKAELPFFLLFLRLFPMSPNWALNMASGVLGVPLHLFFASVFFGLMPYNYLCVTSGAILSEITDVSDILSWSNLGRLATVAFAALLPSLVMKYKKTNKNS